MPLAGVSDAAKEYHARKAAAESGGFLYFSLDDGEEATVRFLEEGSDFTTYFVHRLPQQGNRFPQVPCLDQRPRPDGRIACPGCEENIKRSFRFAINVIWRNGPVYERDENNRLVKDANNKPRVVDHADGVFVWTGGIQIAEDLDHLDGKFGGLTSRDFDVARSGRKLDTTWRILPAGERAPLSESDRKLAGAKFDLALLRKPPEYDQFFAYQGISSVTGGNAGSEGQTPEEAKTRQSPFKRRQRA